MKSPYAKKKASQKGKAKKVKGVIYPFPKPHPPERMGINTTESLSVISLLRLPTFWLMRIMIFDSGKPGGTSSLKRIAWSKLSSFIRVPTRSDR
jgi:hypothetical protein